MILTSDIPTVMQITVVVFQSSLKVTSFIELRVGSYQRMAYQQHLKYLQVNGAIMLYITQVSNS